VLTAYQVVVIPLRVEILDNDLTQAYIAATIGRDHGWNHIYSLELQRQLFAQLRPHLVFDDGAWFTPGPPYAWLIFPLTIFSPAVAVYIWLALSVTSLIAAWWIAAPGTGPTRALWLLGAFAWYPVLYGLSLAQPSLVMVLIVAMAWKLADAQRPYLASVVLGLAVVKPQYVLALPLVLLVAGRWRIVLPLAGIAILFALLSVLSLGADGLNDYRATLAHESQMANNRYFTLAYVLGPGALSYAAPAIIVALTVVGAYLNRHASCARLFALSLVASTFAATYWHLQDFTLLVLAAWLFWRDQPPLWQRLSLLLVVIGGEFAWGLTPLPVLAGVALWFAYLITPRATPKPATVSA
jgi:Glycosyltransferase family 87